jgi:hypothetical protein
MTFVSNSAIVTGSIFGFGGCIVKSYYYVGGRNAVMGDKMPLEALYDRVSWANCKDIVPLGQKPHAARVPLPMSASQLTLSDELNFGIA